MFFLAALFLYVVDGLDMSNLSVGFFINSIVIALVAAMLWHGYVPSAVVGAHKTIPYKALLLSCLPLMGMSVCHVILRWSDALWVGYFLGEADVGVYTVASRLGGVPTFLGVAISAVIAPKYSVAFSEKDYKKIGRLFYQSARMLFLILLPIVAVLVYFADIVLAEISSEYVRGENAFVISILFQALGAVTMPVGYMAIMIGLERSYFVLMLLSLVVNQAFYVTLVPSLGIEGAAIACCFPPLALNCALFCLCNNKLRSLRYDFS